MATRIRRERAAVLVALLAMGCATGAAWPGSPTGAARTDCSSRQSAECGRLIARGPSRPVFAEGFRVAFRATNRRRSVALPSHPRRVRLLDARLLAGRYRLRATVRPCDANCGHLDPPIRCSVPIRITPRRTTAVRLVFSSALHCRLLVAETG